MTTNVTVLRHTFAKTGQYDINVTVYNPLSQKYNSSTIIVQESLNNLMLVSPSGGTFGKVHPFWVNLSSGSDYTCVWNYDDGITVTTDDIQTPISGANVTHLFAGESAYNVTVTCSNDVSSQTAYVQISFVSPIINMRLNKTGALVGTPFAITFRIDGGTDPSFNLTYGGDPLVLTEYNNITMTGTFAERTEPVVGTKIVVLQGWNKISHETVTANFTIETPIINANCTLDGSECMLVNESFTSSCTMDSGTSVQILWKYSDGEEDREERGTLVQWPPGRIVSKTHAFKTSGVVLVAVRNNYDEYYFSYNVKVYNNISGLTMISNSPVRFYPLEAVVCVSFTQQQGLPPTDASIVFDWGDRTEATTSKFALNQIYKHSSPEHNRHVVRASVCNCLGCQVLTVDVESVIPIVNMELLPSPEHVAVGRTMEMCIAMEAGENVTLSCYFDGNPQATTTRPRIGKKTE